MTDETGSNGAGSVAARLIAKYNAIYPNGQAMAYQARRRPASSLAEEVMRETELPSLSWGFEELDRLAPFRASSMAVLIGPTGRGKTAMALQIARHHAKAIGPALFVSAELSGGVAGARLVAQATGMSWFDVLSGACDLDTMRAALDIPRLSIVDDMGPDVLRMLDAEVADLCREYPDKTPLVVVDYLQIVASGGRDMRERVTDVAVYLRQLAGKYRCGVLALSKAGRSAARALRGGESMGTDATEAAAESGAIEHEASVVLALGAVRNDSDGINTIVDVSIAKTRFGAGGDHVVPLYWRGTTGVFSAAGEAVTAGQRREEVLSRAAEQRLDAAKTAILRYLDASDAPVHVRQIRTDLGLRHEIVSVAVKELLSSPGQVVHVGAATRGGHPPLWTSDRVDKARTVPDEA